MPENDGLYQNVAVPVELVIAVPRVRVEVSSLKLTVSPAGRELPAESITANPADVLAGLMVK